MLAERPHFLPGVKTVNTHLLSRKTIAALAAVLVVTSWALADDAISVAALKPGASIGEIMEFVVMPAADVFWGSVGFVSDADGSHTLAPETDSDWAEIRAAAMALSDATVILQEPGRRAEVVMGESPLPGELSATEIDALIAGNRETWIGFARALDELATQAATIADSKDVKGLEDLGGPLDEVCESCHLIFWYPEAQ
jgi:hypothetical protein